MKKRSEPNNSCIPPELLFKEVQLLFELVSPQELRENILELHFHFLIHCDRDALPSHLSRLAENTHLLQAFLKKAEESAN